MRSYADGGFAKGEGHSLSLGERSRDGRNGRHHQSRRAPSRACRLRRMEPPLPDPVIRSPSRRLGTGRRRSAAAPLGAVTVIEVDRQEEPGQRRHTERHSDGMVNGEPAVAPQSHRSHPGPRRSKEVVRIRSANAQVFPIRASARSRALSRLSPKPRQLRRRRSNISPNSRPASTGNSGRRVMGAYHCERRRHSLACGTETTDVDVSE